MDNHNTHVRVVVRLRDSVQVKGLERGQAKCPVNVGSCQLDGALDTFRLPRGENCFASDLGEGARSGAESSGLSL